MGLSYTGMICLLIPFVIGYNRVPEPPARIIPFIIITCVKYLRGKDFFYLFRIALNLSQAIASRFSNQDRYILLQARLLYYKNYHTYKRRQPYHSTQEIR